MPRRRERQLSNRSRHRHGMVEGTTDLFRVPSLWRPNHSVAPQPNFPSHRRYPDPTPQLLLLLLLLLFFFLTTPPITHTHAQTNPSSSMAASPSSSSAAAGAPAFPSPVLALPPPPVPKPSSRRLPPPCWSHEETLALIDAYGDKWHSLGRGNLRAPHWDDVSSAVARDCPSSAPVPKTSVQCRHKIEKLRKRYRSEKQRSLSSWLYFRKMDAMERDVAAAPTEGSGLRFTIPKAVRSKIVGFRPSPRAAIKPELEEMRRRVEERRMKMRKEEGGIGDVAAAIGVFGEGFLKMEHMKMDVSREMEKMKMDMELKRTEMILDCQRQIVETMVHRFMGK